MTLENPNKMAECQETPGRTRSGHVCIPVTNSSDPAIVNAEDFPLVAPYRWIISKSKRNRYAVRSNDGVPMHRLILGLPPGLYTDHINHNGLDNRRENLRPATFLQNGANQRKRITPTTSRFKGITFRRQKYGYRWQAEIRIRINGQRVRYHLGNFVNEEDAARAYDRKAVELFGDFACLNFP